MKIPKISKNRLNKIYKWIIILIILLIAFTIGIFLWARQPIADAKKQAFNIAEKKAKITKTSNFFMSDVNRTYYTVEGTNKNNQVNYVIIDKKTGNINIVPKKNTISKEKAIDIANSSTPINKLISAAPTIFNGKAAWVISYFNKKDNLCYITIDLKSGKVIQSISNL
ncbi:PepSY domain-containing protein [Apilactobacillus apisilvae]|uniref:PepSY domain-containing protein n=1 Tax=Apilactobacillus apisilvae TaxID=2923364 RepID=A0ABY4PIN6_9LACO|nr:PepSY domain-containing protein [Apilactobacillus apisilvae]UQS85359.1 PepSY domain-containing protein [Apilactobacillus apisilvae]